MIKDFKTSTEFINLQNQIINDNITHRKEWEKEAKEVMQSYNGNKFPSLYTDKKTQTSRIIKSTTDKPFVNLIKRQYRTTSNYLLNNEPQYIVTGIDSDANEADLIAKRQFLNSIFESRQE